MHEIDPLSDARWPAFLETHPSASVFHSPAWLSALARTYGYQPAVLTTAKSGTELRDGLVFCRIRTGLGGRRLVSVPFSDHCEPLAADPAGVFRLIEALQHKSRIEGCRYAEVRPVSALVGGGSTFHPDRRFLLHRLDLRPGAAALLPQFHRNCVQRKIKRALREKLAVKAGATPELVDAFFKLVVRTRRRHGLPPQPIEWFRNLAAAGGDSVEVRLALKDGTPIAGIVTLRFGRKLTYKYGASDERFHPTGAMAHLFWTVIQDATHQGLEEFDLGRSDLDNIGLATFKDHWAATRSLVSYWRSPAGRSAERSMLAWGSRQTQHLWPHLPDRLFALTGRLLYKHVG